MEKENLNEAQNSNSVKSDVKHSATDILLLAQEALRNASGAYNALRLLGAERHLPGLSACENKREEALKAINDYLNCT